MFSVCYLFGLDLLVWVNSGGACVVTHNCCVRHSTRDTNSSGLRQFRFTTVVIYDSSDSLQFRLNSCTSNTGFVLKWRVKLTRPISVSCLIIYITPQLVTPDASWIRLNYVTHRR